VIDAQYMMVTFTTCGHESNLTANRLVRSPRASKGESDG
jgi:hypothetical protein